MPSAPEFWGRVEVWLARIASDNTRLAYRRDLEVFVAWLDDSGSRERVIVAADVEGFRAACEAAGSSSATIRRRLAAVSSFYRSHGGAMPNPVGAVERPRREGDDGPSALLDDRSLEAVWSAAVDAGGKTAVLLALLLFDGFSTPQVLGIDVGHLDLGPQRIAISRDGVVVVLDDRTSAAVRSYLGPRRDGPLLIGDRTFGTPERLTRFGVDYLVKQAGRRAGLEGGLTVTTLRRSVATGWTSR